MTGRPVTIRTLDLGYDKAFHAQDGDAFPMERNPGLGCRAIRYCLANLDIFRAQIRAICRASALGEVRLLIPMVSSRDEVQKTVGLVRNVQEKLSDDGIAHNPGMRIGIMVEVPSVALALDHFCDLADFFSIGTNDLIQYLLAVDRANEQVAHLYRAEHPSVLRLLGMVVNTSKANNVPISMCGEMAGDPLFVVFLLGLGLRNFSVSPPQLPEVKRIIRNISLGAARDIASGALMLSSSRDVRNYLRSETAKFT